MCWNFLHDMSRVFELVSDTPKIYVYLNMDDESSTMCQLLIVSQKKVLMVMQNVVSFASSSLFVVL
jgi:hypothetical protein